MPHYTFRTTVTERIETTKGRRLMRGLILVSAPDEATARNAALVRVKRVYPTHDRVILRTMCKEDASAR
jgi:hypothetical protein